MSDDERTSLLSREGRPTSVQSEDNNSTADQEYERLVDVEESDEKKLEIDLLTCSGTHVICRSGELSKSDVSSHHMT